MKPVSMLQCGHLILSIMNISWNGLGSFTITGKPLAGEVTLVTDPFDNSTGLRFSRTLKAAVVVQSHEAEVANNIDAVSGEEKDPFIITHAGEYEVKGIFVTGISAPKKDGTAHTVYRIVLEEIVIGFLGSLDRALTDAELEKLGNIDILLTPAGGAQVLDAKKAAEVVSQVEPRVVIPSYVHVKGVKEKFSDAEGVCKELACAREDVNKFKIKKSGLPSDDMKIVVLARA